MIVAVPRSGRRHGWRDQLGPRRLAGRVAAAGAAIVLASCTAAGGGPAPQSGSAGTDDTANPAADAGSIDLAAEVVASRRDQAGGQIRIRLTNLGDLPVPIDTVRLVAHPYSPEPARINTRELGPGRTVAYPIVHGEPECAGESPTPGPVTVEIDAGDQHVSVVPSDSTNALRRMLTAACGRQRVAELVSIGLDTDWAWTEGGSEQTGTLIITRRTDGPPVTLTGVRGGVNFTLELLESERPSTLEADEEILTVPVRSRAARCEPHALADNSKPYAFTAWVSLAGGPEIHVEFSAADQRGNLDRLCAGE